MTKHELCVIMHTTAITIAMASSVAATEMVFLTLVNCVTLPFILPVIIAEANAPFVVGMISVVSSH